MIKAEFEKHTLKFKFAAGTSRGVLNERDIWLIRVVDDANPDISGIGECAPLKGLSIDDLPEYEDLLAKAINKFNRMNLQAINNPEELAAILAPPELPSIRFGFETAFRDFVNGGKRILFDNNFVRGKTAIPINGLVWMGDKIFILQQIREKMKNGYRCIKIKIGALDFMEECEILDFILIHYGHKKPELRVDANGAFEPESALEKMNVLKNFGIHSIEQPIRAGNLDEMSRLCRESPVPIALDEELIGINSYQEKDKLLDTIRPAYIVLKPSLLGGFAAVREWIQLAEAKSIGWWITSALESNVGLNAIAQFTTEFKPLIFQGLGTGMLYHNNFTSPLTVQKGFLKYDLTKEWF